MSPTPNRDANVLRTYHNMCNEDISDHGELSVESNFQTWEWLDIATKLYEVSTRVAPGFVVYVSDRARDAESRARILEQVKSLNRIMQDDAAE